MRTLLIDDLRIKDVDYTARTYAQGIRALKEGGHWDKLYLDHDLASFYDGKEKTGYDIMCWLEENPQALPGEIELVTANPVGKERMQQVINKLYKERE